MEAASLGLEGATVRPIPGREARYREAIGEPAADPGLRIEPPPESSRGSS